MSCCNTKARPLSAELFGRRVLKASLEEGSLYSVTEDDGEVRLYVGLADGTGKPVSGGDANLDFVLLTTTS